jgi:hypothetical protein
VFQECPLVFPKFTLNGVIVFHCFLLLSWLLCLHCGENSLGIFLQKNILRYNERFVINGVQASDKKICTAFKTIEQARGNTALTYFVFTPH